MKLFFAGIPLCGMLCHPGSIRAALGQPGQQVAYSITCASNSLPFMHLLARNATEEQIASGWHHKGCSLQQARSAHSRPFITIANLACLQNDGSMSWSPRNCRRESQGLQHKS